MKLLVNALIKFTCGLLMVGLLIFLPAGGFSYPGGWLLMTILFVPMFGAGLVMMAKNPSLLEHRLNAREKEAEQGMIVKLSGLMFLCGFVVAGLDFRFGWFPLPAWVRWLAAIVFLIAYLLYAEVLRENTWLSRTIEVQEGQQVVDTGLYGIVRHPMYAVTILLFMMIPLILGSWYALIPFAFYPAIIVVRLKDEEALLTKELPGYEAYKQKVKYRLLPYIW